MKTEITFTFNEEDDKASMHRITNCDAAYGVLSRFQEYLRSQSKYNEDLTEEEDNFLDSIRSKLYDLMEEYGIDLDRDYP